MNSLVGQAVAAIRWSVGSIISLIPGSAGPDPQLSPDQQADPVTRQKRTPASRRKRKSPTPAAKTKAGGKKRQKSAATTSSKSQGQRPAKRQKTRPATQIHYLESEDDSTYGHSGVRTRSMVRASAKQLLDLPDEILTIILSHLSISEKVVVSRVSHKVHGLANDQLRRQTVIGIVAHKCLIPDSSLLSDTCHQLLQLDHRQQTVDPCDQQDHRIGPNDILTGRQLVQMTARKLVSRMPKIRVIKFDDQVDGRSEMREAEILICRLRDSLICFHCPALSLKSHKILCRNLHHLSVHSLSMDHRTGSGSGSGGPAAILKSVKSLRCKEMCPKVFKRLPDGLISLKTDTHGRNFINFLLKSPATASLQVMKVTNFYSQSIDPFVIPNLRHLSIQGYFVHDTSTQFLRSLAASADLRHLKLQFFTEIRQNQFPQFIKISAEEWIRFLSKVRSLETLEIWASLVNDSVVRCIAQNLSHSLQSLVLHWSCLTDEGLNHLSDMRNLTVCRVMSEDNDFSADAIIAFVEKQRSFPQPRLTSLSIKTKSSLSGQDERLHQILSHAQASSCMKQIQVCCIRQQQTFRLF